MLDINFLIFMRKFRITKESCPYCMIYRSKNQEKEANKTSV